MTRLGKSKPATIYESNLADYLDKIGYDYRCQVSFPTNNDTTIRVDFLIDDIDLVIEVDGSNHYQMGNRLYDDWKDNQLMSMGFRVARITHDSIINLGIADAMDDATSKSTSRFDVYKSSKSNDGPRDMSYDTMSNNYALALLYSAIVDGVNMILHNRPGTSVSFRIDYLDTGGSISHISFGNTDVWQSDENK